MIFRRACGTQTNVESREGVAGRALREQSAKRAEGNESADCPSGCACGERSTLSPTALRTGPRGPGEGLQNSNTTNTEWGAPHSCAKREGRDSCRRSRSERAGIVGGHAAVLGPFSTHWLVGPRPEDGEGRAGPRPRPLRAMGEGHTHATEPIRAWDGSHAAPDMQVRGVIGTRHNGIVCAKVNEFPAVRGLPAVAVRLRPGRKPGSALGAQQGGARGRKRAEMKSDSRKCFGCVVGMVSAV